MSENGFGRGGRPLDDRFATAREDVDLGHGDVLIAAITSCTNTSNPAVMIAAGLLARRRSRAACAVKPHQDLARARLAVVTDYLGKAGLLEPLATLGFALAGYGCTTCIGNAGDSAPEFNAAIAEHDLVVAAVLSGQPQLRGRIHPNVRANYLASPPLVVAFTHLRAGRHRPRHTSRSVPAVTASRCSCATSGRVRTRSPPPSPSPPTGHLSPAVRRLHRDHDLWNAIPAPTGRGLRLAALHLHRLPALLRRLRMAPPPARDIHNARPAAARRLGNHRPHLAAGSFRETSRRALAARAGGERTSTPTARAAATTT